MTEWNEREVKPLAEAEALFRAWLAHLDEELKKQESPDRRAEIVRDELIEIYLGRPRGSKMTTTLASEMAIYVTMLSMDPRNASMDADYAQGLDAGRYAPRRPLIYFWQMFDRSPLGANLWLGFRFRCMLGRHIFRSVGKGVKIYPGVTFGPGYGIAIEDGCVIGRGARLEDGGGELVIPAGTKIEPGATFGGKRG